MVRRKYFVYPLIVVILAVATFGTAKALAGDHSRRQPIAEFYYLGSNLCHIDVLPLQTVAYKSRPHLLRFRTDIVCNWRPASRSTTFHI